MTVELKLHDRQQLTFNRELKDLAEYDLAAVKLDRREMFRLYWGPPSIFGYGDGSSKVSLAQAQCLQRLIVALDAGSPDVSEGELQEVTGQPLTEVFPGLPKGEHGRLVIAGKNPGTWRIRELETE